jgi:tight adherence protein B
VIVLDVHQSSSGLLSDEQAAALGYVQALPSGVQAGLITFSTDWQLVLAPTTDRAQLTAALDNAVSGAGTTSAGLGPALTGAATALAALGPTAGSGDRLLVLSDGASLTTVPAAGSIPVDVLTWQFDSGDNVGAVQALASATGGKVGNPADAAALAALVTAASPPTAAARPRASAPVSTPAVARASAVAGATAPASRSVPVWLVAAVFVVCLALASLLIRALRQGNNGHRRLAQIERYGPSSRSASAAEPAGTARTARAMSAALNLTGSVLRTGNSEPRLAARLDGAGITRKPAEWALLGGCATAVLVAVIAVLTRNVLIAVPLGVLCGWAGMRSLLSIRIARRRAAFAEQLPDVLQLVASSLKAGFSLPQALDGVTREDTQPSSGEFARALAEARLGAELEQALGGVAERMDSVDMRWTVMAIRIQREVGGNLAEVLRNTVDTIRERAYLRRQVRTLSGEGRLSAYILVAIPLVLAGWLFYSSGAYMRPLYTTVWGLLMIVGASVLFVIGVLWMRVLIRMEV